MTWLSTERIFSLKDKKNANWPCVRHKILTKTTSCRCICLSQKCSGKWTGPGVERWKTKDPETSLASWQCQQTLQWAADIKHTHPGVRTGNLSSLDLQRVRSGSPAVLPAGEARWRLGTQTERQRDGCEDFFAEARRAGTGPNGRNWGFQLVSDDISWWWQVGLNQTGY